MQMGISSFLKLGRIRLNPQLQQIEVEVGHPECIPYEQVSPSDWGYVYEKYVGQVLEDEGYQVTYRGLTSGFLDNGIDLIASSDDELLFVQCKFQKKRLTKSHIEWILYKASNELYKNHSKLGKRITFMLITRNKDMNFSTRIPKGFRLAHTPIEKVTHPMLQYFLEHNYIQDKVKLSYREIEMPL